MFKLINRVLHEIAEKEMSHKGHGGGKKAMPVVPVENKSH